MGSYIERSLSTTMTIQKDPKYRVIYRLSSFNGLKSWVQERKMFNAFNDWIHRRSENIERIHYDFNFAKSYTNFYYSIGPYLKKMNAFY